MIAQLETATRNLSTDSVYKIEGLIQIFTCDRRSFFTGVMSQALRIASQGTPVLVVQFLKGGISQGCDRPMRLGKNLDWLRCDIPRCINTPQIETPETLAVQELWHHTRQLVSAGKYSLVVLDELSLAVNFGFIDENQVLEFLKHRPPQVDVILTGPEMPTALLAVADQITEIRRSHQP
ncbi:MAG: P-loop NTPase family protein [Oscillatoria sp. PMC 1076.18]|nr:P-loop NTPase family protein [Oscillatoria sp. PMC 1076.18]